MPCFTQTLGVSHPRFSTSEPPCAVPPSLYHYALLLPPSVVVAPLFALATHSTRPAIDWVTCDNHGLVTCDLNSRTGCSSPLWLDVMLIRQLQAEQQGAYHNKRTGRQQQRQQTVCQRPAGYQQCIISQSPMHTYHAGAAVLECWSGNKCHCPDAIPHAVPPTRYDTACCPCIDLHRGCSARTRSSGRWHMPQRQGMAASAGQQWC